MSKDNNPMKEIVVEKVTLNAGIGGGGEKLNKAVKLIKKVCGKEPVKTHAKKRIPSWHLRPGLEIGCKITLRGKEAENILKKLLSAVNNKLKSSSFDKLGNFSFGIKEYIDIPGMDYDPSIGMMGFDVCVSLIRRGYRVSRRKVKNSKIGKSHLIKPSEAMEFVKKKFGVEII